MIPSQTPTLVAGSVISAETAHLFFEWVKTLTPSSAPEWVLPVATDCGHWLLYLLSLRLVWLAVPVVASGVCQMGSALMFAHTTVNTWAAALRRAVKRALCALLERIRMHLSSD